MGTLAAVLQRIGGSPGREGAAKRVRRAQTLLSLGFLAGFALVSGRAILYAEYPGEMMPMLASSGAQPGLAKNRPDIVDRNGTLLATDIRIYWLAANPREIPHADEAAEKLAAIFPDLDQGALSRRFHDKSSRFEWVKRGLTPYQAAAVHRLGIPGLTILPTVQRAYPAGSGAAQILGITNVDNEGMSGIEWYIDQKLMGQLTPASLDKRPFLKLSLDIGIQHALASELSEAMERYQAQAALGLVMNVKNGEVLASISLPGFDPNRRGEAKDENRRNRIVTDVYELGSVFKTFTVAMALDAGIAGRYDRFDTSTLRMGRFLLHDAHAAREPMTVEDIFVHSINTGAARIAEAAGVERQQRFLESLGLFDKLETEAGTGTQAGVPIGLAACQRHDHRLRPRDRGPTHYLRLGDGNDRERRRAHQADLPARGRRCRRGSGKANQARDHRANARPDAARRAARHGPQGRRRRCGHRRQDGNRAQSEGRALHPRCGQQLRGGAARIRSAISGPGDSRRAETRNAGEIERGRL